MRIAFYFQPKRFGGFVCPSRTCFFAWEAIWEIFLTIDMLMKRGWSMVNRFSLCKDSDESVDHILIHCGRIRELWTLLLSSFGLVWVFLASVRNLLLEWKVKGLGKKRRVVWDWRLFVFFGVFGESETEERSKRKRCQIPTWGTSFFGLFYSGLNSFCI